MSCFEQDSPTSMTDNGFSRCQGTFGLMHQVLEIDSKGAAKHGLHIHFNVHLNTTTTHADLAPQRLRGAP